MSIPVFGISDVEGTVHPMFDDLGVGYGSVELPSDSPSNRVHSITLKCYPRLLYYLKSHRLTSNIPSTNWGMRSKLTMIERSL